MKKTLLFLLCILTTTFAHSQKNDYWMDVMKNERANALQKVTAANSQNPSIETRISKALIRKESGKSNFDAALVDQILADENWEMYVFALWNESMLFGNYLNDGFDNETVALINKIYAKDIKNQTLRESVWYLKAIIDRRANNFSGYAKNTGLMTTVRHWQFCGAFENLNNSGIDAIYPPETMAISKEDFNANSNGAINWYNAPYSRDGYTHLGNHSEYGSGVHYAQTFFNNATAREAYIRVGSSSKTKVWLNDVLIFESTKDVNTDLDAYNVKLNLPAGSNRLLVKLAEPSGSPYFSVRITDKNGKAFTDLTYSNTYAEYQKSTLEALNPVYENTVFEEFFIKKRNEDPENFLYNYCLMRTYLRNERHEEAKEIVEVWYDKYPSSSLIRVLMIDLYGYDDNSDGIQELRENIEYDDPEYYISYLMKFGDVQELFRMSNSDMEAFLDKLSDMMNNDFTTNVCGLLKAIRVEDRSRTRFYLERIVNSANSSGDLESVMTYLPFYSSLLEDDKKMYAAYKKLDKKYFSYDLKMRMANYYSDMNNFPKVISILKYIADNNPDLAFKKNIAYCYQGYGYFAESKKYIQECLNLFPYSFTSMEIMGDALLQTGDQNGAIDYYNKSLFFNSGNSDLRRKIRDITNQPDVVEDYRVKDIYKFIKEERNVITENNYGYNMLLDQKVVQLYDQAGGKRRYTYVFEVTSTQGVERMTEYDLGLYSGFQVIKSEIIKKNGSIVPAETNYSSFVFNGLEIGDVIHIDYETYFNGYGRFYKDFVATTQLDSYHPMALSTYTLIVPNEIQMNFSVKNGELEPAIIEKDNSKIYTWKLEHTKGKPSYEDFMPEREDEFLYLHMSSIKSWTDIAFWYSDLVRSQLETNSTVVKVFKELFPETDLSTISENDKAQRIYYYLMENFNYSHVSFKQSGYVPQKPSKTINTKLGDCKDFSTLYVALAQMANLEANLVLVLTGDNGKQSLVLPSQNFNHCIVQVKIDGEKRFLELTDKNLPYQALPRSLRGATILEIPYKYTEGQQFDLQLIEDPKRQTNVHAYTVTLQIGDDKKSATIDAELRGSTRSYYRAELEEPNNKMLKNKVYNHFDHMFGDNMKIDSVYNIAIDKKAESLKYTTEVSVKEKVKKIGGIKIIELPEVSESYTGKIIEKEERKYPIQYTKYESIDRYETKYIIRLAENEAFTELPEDVVLTFKGHKYERTYEKIAPNELHVKIVATPDWRDISVAEYEAFKDYVTSVIEAKEAFIGYK